MFTTPERANERTGDFVLWVKHMAATCKSKDARDREAATLHSLLGAREGPANGNLFSSRASRLGFEGPRFKPKAQKHRLRAPAMRHSYIPLIPTGDAFFFVKGVNTKFQQ